MCCNYREAYQKRVKGAYGTTEHACEKLCVIKISILLCAGKDKCFFALCLSSIWIWGLVKVLDHTHAFGVNHMLQEVQQQPGGGRGNKHTGVRPLGGFGRVTEDV